MLLIVHIVLAVTSIVGATFVAVKPSKNKLVATFCLSLATLFSGGLLVVLTHTALMQACASGLLYLSSVSILLAVARYRLRYLLAR